MNAVIRTDAFWLVVAIVAVTLVAFAAVAARMIEAVGVCAANIWIWTLVDVCESEDGKTVPVIVILTQLHILRYTRCTYSWFDGMLVDYTVQTGSFCLTHV